MTVKIESLRKLQRRDYLVIVLLCAVLFLAACVGSPKAESTYKLADVQASIATAKENEAHVHAPMELNKAEEKFRAAEVAIAKNDYDIANTLLDEALLDAKHAEVKSEVERAKERVTEARETIETLRFEMQINR